MFFQDHSVLVYFATECIPSMHDRVVVNGLGSGRIFFTSSPFWHKAECVRRFDITPVCAPGFIPTIVTVLQIQFCIKLLTFVQSQKLMHQSRCKF